MIYLMILILYHIYYFLYVFSQSCLLGNKNNNYLEMERLVLLSSRKECNSSMVSWFDILRACLKQRNRKHRNDKNRRKKVGVNSQNRGIKKHRKDNEGKR
jgi:hypothetical protein